MNVLLGIGGGISAYKVLWFIRLLKLEQHAVKVILTKAAQKFVTPTSVHALSGEPPFLDLWQSYGGSQTDLPHSGSMPHIDLAKWADILIIAPATCSRISDIVQGSARDLLGNVILASKAPLAVVPAMNQQMFHNPATQNNLSLLRNRKISIWGPSDGEQACGDTGEGRMLEPEDLINRVKQWTSVNPFSFRTVTITNGATVESIDPVRHISNKSSGKFGLEIAKACAASGASVQLIQAPNHLNLENLPTNISLFPVVSASDMLEKANELADVTDLFIACAAVSDYRLKFPFKHKMKKTNEQTIRLDLIQNKDIIASIAARPKRPFTVGFALETENLLENAEAKLIKKNIDVIVANLADNIGSDQMEAHIIWFDTSGKKNLEMLKKNNKQIQAILLLKTIQQIFERKCLSET